MSDEGRLDAVLAEVRERIEPTAEERSALAAAVEAVLERTRQAVAGLPVEAEVVHVGSTARDTWLAGDRDIDVFVRFSPELDREALEEYGLRVGREVLPDGREEFAEHPYVTGSLDGFEADVVPCYAVEDPAAIRSAVDRTPFHDAYVAERLDEETAADVRLAKQLLVAIGAYGSDLRTRGYSGYLTELLVLEYGSVEALLETAADWRPPVRLDPEGHGTATFDDPLVVVDPTDPGRNVAAVCSPANVARLQHHARELLAAPAVEHFVAEPVEPLTAAELSGHLARRGTTPVAVRFPAPDLVDDQLYPQLRKSLAGVVGGLDRRGFDVLRAETWADGTAVLLAELEVAERPAVGRHDGPPVHVHEHAVDFYDTYKAGDAYGPFLDGDRYVVEREREFASARAFLESDAVFDVALGARVTDAMTDGYDLLVGEAVEGLLPEFGAELRRYFEPRV